MNYQKKYFLCGEKVQGLCKLQVFEPPRLGQDTVSESPLSVSLPSRCSSSRSLLPVLRWGSLNRCLTMQALVTNSGQDLVKSDFLWKEKPLTVFFNIWVYLQICKLSIAFLPTANPHVRSLRSHPSTPKGAPFPSYLSVPHPHLILKMLLFFSYPEH